MPTQSKGAWPDEVLAAIDAVEDKYDIVLVSGPHHQEWVERSEAQAKEIERLRSLLGDADKVVVWEHTYVRAGFQEEIEEALGSGRTENKRPKTEAERT